MKTKKTGKSKTAVCNIEMEFMEEMRNHGLEPAEVPRADGELHRIRDTRDKPGKKDLYYRLHDDGYPEGIFGHWSRLPDTKKWQPKHKNKLTHEERHQLKQLHEQRRVADELALQERRTECRARAAKMFAMAKDASNDHEYLKQKNVNAHGIKELDEVLLIPLYKDGILTGLQLILSEGTKRFLPGTEKTGAYFSIPGKGNNVYIAEGYSTAATIHELTGCTVHVAFDCGNLKAVAKAVKTAHPECELVICADNDRHTPGNPGLTNAKAAALATDAKLAIPTFPGDEGTDFNDMVAICGKGGAIC